MNNGGVASPLFLKEKDYPNEYIPAAVSSDDFSKELQNFNVSDFNNCTSVFTVSINSFVCDIIDLIN